MEQEESFTVFGVFGGRVDFIFFWQVEALIGVLEDESNPYGMRNSAIWALGQLGDRRALPVLENLYTGDIPEREPWDGTLSQHELSKAIKLARGGFNATAIFWRNSLIIQ